MCGSGLRGRRGKQLIKILIARTNSHNCQQSQAKVASEDLEDPTSSPLIGGTFSCKARRLAVPVVFFCFSSSPVLNQSNPGPRMLGQCRGVKSS